MSQSPGALSSISGCIVLNLRVHCPQHPGALSSTSGCNVLTCFGIIVYRGYCIQKVRTMHPDVEDNAPGGHADLTVSVESA